MNTTQEPINTNDSNYLPREYDNMLWFIDNKPLKWYVPCVEELRKFRNLKNRYQKAYLAKIEYMKKDPIERSDIDEYMYIQKWACLSKELYYFLKEMGVDNHEYILEMIRRINNSAVSQPKKDKTKRILPSNELKRFIPKNQLSAMRGNVEISDAISHLNKLVANFPKLYATDGQSKHPLILHYFTSSCDWYICECEGDALYGYVILNNDPQNAEWGYSSLEVLLASEDMYARRLDCLNLDLYPSHAYIEDAIAKK